MAGSFRILPGGAGSPVVLHVPHSSRAIPEWVRERLLLEPAEVERELDRLTDSGTSEAAAAASLAAPTPWRFVNECSRLVIDPERFPDDREELNAVGMGAVYTRTSHGDRLRDDDVAHRDRLLGTYFRPYASALADLVDARLAETGAAVLIDVHSFPAAALPYELHQHARRPHVCLGTDGFHTPAWLIEAAHEAFHGFEVIENEPFAGTYVPLRHFRNDSRVASIMVELRRDLLTDRGRAEAVGAALRRLVEAGTAGSA